MEQPVLVLDNVTAGYGAVRALHDVSGAFAQGSLTAVAGPNGAGKSTLLKVIAGLLRPLGGRVVLSDSVKRKIGYLPQASTLQRDYPLSVEQAVATGLWRDLGETGALDTKNRQRIRAALAQVGMEDLADRPIAALSGGQFQRLLFARLLLQDPELVLLDEPFASVDAETTAQLIRILLDWHRAGKTIICVLHDLLLIRKYFPESILLAGKCMGKGHTHALFEQKLLSFDLDMAEIVTTEEGEHGSCDHRH